MAYVIAIGSAPFSSWLPQAIYVGVALVWLVSDRRVERALRDRESARTLSH